MVESARASVYRTWSQSGADYEASAARSTARAEIVRDALDDHGARPDPDFVEGHASWMTSVSGAAPGEVPLAELFLLRLGDWVDGHVAGFLGAAGERFTALAREEKEGVGFPDSLPPPPPFERLREPRESAPGEVVIRVAILADLHIGSAAGERMARAAIADINRSGAGLVIQLGDVTDRGRRQEFERAVEVLAEVEAPLATMIGNHDVYAVDEERLGGREYFPTAFGRQPDGVVLDEAGFRFAVLDSAEHAMSPFPGFDLVTGGFGDAPGGAVVRGSLSTPQHDLLADIAAPGSNPTFVFLHHPPQPFLGFPPVVFGLRDADSGRLHATIDSGNVWGVFAGHTHRNARTRDFDGVPAHEVATPRDYPFGFGLLDVSRSGYWYRFVQISDDALLEERAKTAGTLMRRYSEGSPGDRSFTWEAP